MTTILGTVLMAMGSWGIWYALKGDREKLKKIVGTDKRGVAAVVSALAILMGFFLIIMRSAFRD